MQGHLRLVLLPIVYNAMALKELLRQLPLFRALQAVLRASAYDCLLRHPLPDPATPEIQARWGALSTCHTPEQYMSSQGVSRAERTVQVLCISPWEFRLILPVGA